MKKRHAALAALALVGILSGCGQAKTQPADNTISITPVEQAGTLAVYTYSGNNTEANGIEFRHDACCNRENPACVACTLRTRADVARYCS